MDYTALKRTHLTVGKILNHRKVQMSREVKKAKSLFCHPHKSVTKKKKNVTSSLTLGAEENCVSGDSNTNLTTIILT